MHHASQTSASPNTPVHLTEKAGQIAESLTRWGPLKAAVVYNTLTDTLANSQVLRGILSGLALPVPFFLLPNRSVTTRVASAITLGVGVYQLWPMMLKPVSNLLRPFALPRLQNWVEQLQFGFLQKDFLHHLCGDHQHIAWNQDTMPTSFSQSYSDLTLTGQWLENPTQTLKAHTINRLVGQARREEVEGSHSYNRERAQVLKRLCIYGTPVNLSGEPSCTEQKLSELYSFGYRPGINDATYYLTQLDLPGPDWHARPAINEALENLETGDKVLLLGLPDMSQGSVQQRQSAISTFGLYKNQDGTCVLFHPRYGYFRTSDNKHMARLIEGLMRCNQQCTQLVLSAFRSQAPLKPAI